MSQDTTPEPTEVPADPPTEPKIEESMSDTPVSADYLQRRVAELEHEKTQLQNALKGERRTTREIREALGVKSIGEATARIAEILQVQDDIDAVLDDYERLQDLAASPDEKDEMIAALTDQLTERDHRDAFAAAKLAPGATVQELWSKLQYTPEGDAPTAETVAELLAKARESAAYLFAPDEAEPSSDSRPSEPPSGPGGGRGARDNPAARVRYTRSEIAKPGWQQERPELVEALQKGAATLVDD